MDIFLDPRTYGDLSGAPFPEDINLVVGHGDCCDGASKGQYPDIPNESLSPEIICARV